MSKHRKWILPILVLAISGVTAVALVKSRPPVSRAEVETVPPLVRVRTVALRDTALDVHAQGTVLPRTETTLVAQVAGVVTAVSTTFEVGGFVRRGDVLVTLDRRDYDLAVRRAEAQVAQARLGLAREEAEKRVAIQEWRSLGTDATPDPLVLRTPQIAQAQAAVAAAEADLDKTRLDLERTEIRAPFAGRVRATQVDRGQFVGPGTPVGVVHAIDYAEVRLPVADDQLAFLDLPATYSDGAGARGPAVTLSSRFAGAVHSWQGRIVRTEGELDPSSRMLTLVARVERPYDRPRDGSERPPLRVGLYVDAAIEGKRATATTILPRAALRVRDGVASTDGTGQVLVVEDGRLRFRDVGVVRIDGDDVVIDRGLSDGDHVCVSLLDVVVDGMAVRTVEDDAEPGATPRVAVEAAS